MHPPPDECQYILRPQLKDILVLESNSHQIYPPGKCVHHNGAGPRMNLYIRPARDVYSWSRLTPLNAVKAVVIGQVGSSSLAFRHANSPLPLVKTRHDASQAHHPGYSSTSPCVNSSGLSSPSCHRQNCPDRSRTSTNSSRTTSLPFPLPQQGHSPLSSPCPPLSSRCRHLVHALS